MSGYIYSNCYIDTVNNWITSSNPPGTVIIPVDPPDALEFNMSILPSSNYSVSHYIGDVYSNVITGYPPNSNTNIVTSIASPTSNINLTINGNLVASCNLGFRATGCNTYNLRKRPNYIQSTWNGSNMWRYTLSNPSPYIGEGDQRVTFNGVIDDLVTFGVDAPQCPVDMSSYPVLIGTLTCSNIISPQLNLISSSFSNYGTLSNYQGLSNNFSNYVGLSNYQGLSNNFSNYVGLSNYQGLSNNLSNYVGLSNYIGLSNGIAGVVQTSNAVVTSNLVLKTPPSTNSFYQYVNTDNNPTVSILNAHDNLQIGLDQYYNSVIGSHVGSSTSGYARFGKGGGAFYIQVDSNIVSGGCNFNWSRNQSLSIPCSTGYVGINMVNPQYQLDVLGTARASGYILGANSNVFTGLISQLSNDVNLATTSQLASNNTNFTTCNLQVTSNWTYTGTNPVLLSNNSASYLQLMGSNNAITRIYANSDGLTYLQAQNNFFLGTINNTTNPYLYINSVNRYIGVNTSNPRYTLDVNGTINVASNLFVNGTIGNQDLFNLSNVGYSASNNSFSNTSNIFTFSNDVYSNQFVSIRSNAVSQYNQLLGLSNLEVINSNNIRTLTVNTSNLVNSSINNPTSLAAIGSLAGVSALLAAKNISLPNALTNAFSPYSALSNPLTQDAGGQIQDALNGSNGNGTQIYVSLTSNVVDRYFAQSLGYFAVEKNIIIGNTGKLIVDNDAGFNYTGRMMQYTQQSPTTIIDPSAGYLNLAILSNVQRITGSNIQIAATSINTNVIQLSNLVTSNVNSIYTSSSNITACNIAAPSVNFVSLNGSNITTSNLGTSNFTTTSLSATGASITSLSTSSITASNVSATSAGFCNISLPFISYSNGVVTIPYDLRVQGVCKTDRISMGEVFPQINTSYQPGMYVNSQLLFDTEGRWYQSAINQTAASMGTRSYNTPAFNSTYSANNPFSWG